MAFTFGDMMIFIGDTHGKFSKYFSLIEKYEASIQVGDFGLGFAFYPEKDHSVVERLRSFPSHRFIRGNHDHLETCETSPNFIADGTVIDNMMFVGGAKSTDQHRRTAGIDWWPNEEVSYNRFIEILELYEETKPEIMITHDCPQGLMFHMKSHYAYEKTMTRNALDVFYKVHQPKLWIFGHHHKSFDETVDGTRFFCLDELETVEI